MNKSDIAHWIAKIARQEIKHTEYGEYGVQPEAKKAKVFKPVQTKIPGPKYDSDYVGYSMKYAEAYENIVERDRLLANFKRAKNRLDAKMLLKENKDAV